jgi:hypothetical protein
MGYCTGGTLTPEGRTGWSGNTREDQIQCVNSGGSWSAGTGGGVCDSEKTAQMRISGGDPASTAMREGVLAPMRVIRDRTLEHPVVRDLHELNGSLGDVLERRAASDSVFRDSLVEALGIASQIATSMLAPDAPYAVLYTASLHEQFAGTAREIAAAAGDDDTARRIQEVVDQVGAFVGASTTEILATLTSGSDRPAAD